MSGRDPWDEEDPLEKMFREIFRQFRRMFRELDIDPEKLESRKPYIRGFSITIGPDGVPRFRELGRDELRGVREKEAKPSLDIIEMDDRVMVVLDMPGIDEDTLMLRVKDGKLYVKAEGRKKYYEVINLPSTQYRDILKYEYNNGVLTVEIGRKKGIKRFL